MLSSARSHFTVATYTSLRTVNAKFSENFAEKLQIIFGVGKKKK